jgi:hypothetical protein
VSASICATPVKTPSFHAGSGILLHRFVIGEIPGGGCPSDPKYGSKLGNRFPLNADGREHSQSCVDALAGGADLRIAQDRRHAMTVSPAPDSPDVRHAS